MLYEGSQFLSTVTQREGFANFVILLLIIYLPGIGLRTANTQIISHPTGWSPQPRSHVCHRQSHNLWLISSPRDHHRLTGFVISMRGDAFGYWPATLAPPVVITFRNSIYGRLQTRLTDNDHDCWGIRRYRSGVGESRRAVFDRSRCTGRHDNSV